MPAQTQESPLVGHVQRELELAGLFDADSDYGGMIGESVIAHARLFSSQGHSGFSAALTLEILSKVLSYGALTPLSYGADQWVDQSSASGVPMWQHKRDSRVFSDDGGETHYVLGDA